MDKIPGANTNFARINMQELKSIVTPVNNCKPIKLLWYNSMNLPPTGLPKSTAIEMNADWIPFLVPI